MGEGRKRSWGSDPGATDRPTGRRLSVPEAADALGISADAVRSRIKRGTLQTEREGGRVFVVLGAGEATARAQPTNAQGATDPPTDQAADDLREQVRYLREQLRREQDAHEQTRRLLGGALERIPAIEASEAPEAPRTPETATEKPEGTPPRSDSPGPQSEATAPRRGLAKLWRRWFDG